MTGDPAAITGAAAAMFKGAAVLWVWALVLVALVPKRRLW